MTKSFVAKSLPMGPESSLDPERKVQQGIIPIKLSDAVYFKAHTGRINALIPVESDGVITGGDDGQVLLSRFVETASRLEFVSETLLAGTKPILALSLSPDKRYLAIAQTSLVVVFDMRDRDLRYAMTRMHGRITSLAWDPRGEFLALGRAGGDIYLWSLGQSFFSGQGRDSVDSLEQYLGGQSPVIFLAFHPSGGAFFSAGLEGELSIWRALRTEDELGLRDRFNLGDQEKIGLVHQQFAQLPGFASDTYLEPDGEYLFAAAANGKLYSWKTRGLIPQAESIVSKDSLLSFTPVKLPGTAFEGLSIMMSSTQDQKTQVLCLKRMVDPSPSTTSSEYILLAETPPLRETLGRIRAGAEGELIWAAEKADAVVAFKRGPIAAEIAASPRFKECTREPNQR